MSYGKLQEIQWIAGGKPLEASADIYGLWKVVSPRERLIIGGRNDAASSKVAAMIANETITKYNLSSLANLLGVNIYEMDKWGNPMIFDEASGTVRSKFASDKQLRASVIRLAHSKPTLRPVLLPLLKKQADGGVIASNEAIYQWEYKYISRTANLYEKNGTLRLQIVEFSEDSGLRPSSRTEILKEVPVGTLAKPDLRVVVTLLKNYNFERTAASRGFKRLWFDSHGKEDSLGNIIKAYKAAAPSTQMDDKKRAVIQEKLKNLSGAELDRILKLL